MPSRTFRKQNEIQVVTMDIWKKSIILGLALLAFCVLVETMGFCKFKKMFPPKEQLREDNGTECSPAYTKSFNGSSYKFVESCQGLTRSAARSDCESDSSHLVSIETREENDFLIKEASRATKYWIGLFSPNRHLFWDNGNQVTFINLDPLNQDTFNDGTGCFKMSNSEGRYWLDKSCVEELGFICEYEGSGCPYNFVYVFKNSCYAFVNDSPASRITAKLKCENSFSHLVYIETKEENDFVVARAQKGTEYWIGLHDRPQLFWENGYQATFVNINQNYDTTFNLRSGCYWMSKQEGRREWRDKKCAKLYSYACETEDSGCSSVTNGSFNPSCYTFVGQRVNRSAARSACLDNSSHLVFIETKEENDFLDHITPPDEKFWIGLFSPHRHLFWDNNHQVTFVNMDSQNKFTYDDKTGCYMMSATDERYWLGMPCEAKIGYICEFKGSVCPYDTVNSFNNSCYKFVNNSPASRISAQSKCESDSSHLVFIESKDENDFLVRKAQNNTQYWIGLHDRPQLFWDDGEEASYTNIDAGQDVSFNGRTGCYQMSYHNGAFIWFDEPCDDSYGYICEYEGY